MKNRPIRWRRYFQFRLRTLFLVGVLVSVACSWFATIRQSARRQRDAVKAIEAIDGVVLYDWHGESAEPSGPAWVRVLLGDDFLDSVVWVDVSEADCGDEIMPYLERFGQLEILDLSHSRVSDGGLSHIKRLTKLQHLHLNGTRIGDAGVAHLRGLVKLEWLQLDHTHVSDVGLKHLGNLGSLCELTLYDTRVTEVAVERLRNALPKARIRSSW